MAEGTAGGSAAAGGTGQAVGALFTQVMWHENPHTLEGKKETMFKKNSFLQREHSLSTHYRQSVTLDECLSLVLF